MGDRRQIVMQRPVVTFPEQFYFIFLLYISEIHLRLFEKFLVLCFNER